MHTLLTLSVVLLFSALSAAQSAISVTPNGYGYLGCFNDLVSGQRTVAVAYSVANLTIENCAVNCLAQNNWLISGAEGSGCYCGNSLHAPPDGRVAEANCASACPGNSTEACGNANGYFVSVYSRDPTACFFNGTTGSGAACSAVYASTMTTYAAATVTTLSSTAGGGGGGAAAVTTTTTTSSTAPAGSPVVVTVTGTTSASTPLTQTVRLL